MEGVNPQKEAVAGLHVRSCVTRDQKAISARALRALHVEQEQNKGDCKPRLSACYH